MLSPLAGTPYADVPAFGRAHADEGLLVYLEVCEHGAYDVCRILHGLRHAGLVRARERCPRSVARRRRTRTT